MVVPVFWKPVNGQLESECDYDGCRCMYTNVCHTKLHNTGLFLHLHDGRGCGEVVCILVKWIVFSQDFL